MTTYTTNAEFSARSHRIAKGRDVAEARIWHWLPGLTTLFTRRPVDLDEELARAARREDARRAVTNLLR